MVGLVEWCAKFVRLLKGYGYGRRTRCGGSRSLRRSAKAAEVFAEPNVENEVSDDKMRRWLRTLSLFYKKPHRADGELTLSERKFEAENTAEKMEVSDENNQAKAVVQSEEVELKRKKWRSRGTRCKRRFRRLRSE